MILRANNHPNTVNEAICTVCFLATYPVLCFFYIENPCSRTPIDGAYQVAY